MYDCRFPDFIMYIECLGWPVVSCLSRFPPVLVSLYACLVLHIHVHVYTSTSIKCTCTCPL